MSPYIAWLLSTGQNKEAFFSLFFAGALDWADGLVARKFKGQASLLGSFLDPLADKTLVACAGLSLAFSGLLSPALVFVVVGRDALLVVGSLIYRYKHRSQGEPFFSLQKVTFKVEPSQLSKANTALQLLLVVTAIASAAWPQFALGSVELASLPFDNSVSWIPDSWWPSHEAATTSGTETAGGAGAGGGAASMRPSVLPITLKPVVDSLSWLVGGTTIATGLDYLFRGGFGKLKLSGKAAAASAAAAAATKRAGELFSQAQGKAQQLRSKGGMPKNPPF